MNFVTISWIIGSIAFSVPIVIVNKKLMQDYNFNCTMFLTSFHFLLTFLLLEAMCRMGLFERANNVPTFERWYLAAIGIATVIGQNFNLYYNSVGFYQLSKLCSIPFMVVYHYFVDSKVTPYNILASLTLLLIGIGFFSINDVSFNIFGCIIAIFATTIGSLNTLFSKSKQTFYHINGPSLQHATSLQQFILSIVSAIIGETSGSHNIFNIQFTKTMMILITISGLLAVGVNACSFGLIGKTSPITFQVVGHVKTILIFLFGIIFFQHVYESKVQSIKKVVSISIAMIGVILYTYYEMKNKEEEQKNDTQSILVADGPDEVREMNNNKISDDSDNQK